MLRQTKIISLSSWELTASFRPLNEAQPIHFLNWAQEKANLYAFLWPTVKTSPVSHKKMSKLFHPHLPKITFTVSSSQNFPIFKAYI